MGWRVIEQQRFGTQAWRALLSRPEQAGGLPVRREGCVAPRAAASQGHCDRAAAPLRLEDRVPTKVGLVRVRVRVRDRVRVPAKVGLGVEGRSIRRLGPTSRPHCSRSLGSGRLSGASRVRSAGKSRERRAQVAGPVSCGATKRPLNFTSWSAGPRAGTILPGVRPSKTMGVWPGPAL